MIEIAGGIVLAYLILALLPWAIIGVIAAWRWIAAMLFVSAAFILLIVAPNIFILFLAAFLAFWLVWPARKNLPTT